MSLVTVAENFAKGYMSDVPRDQLPPSVAYRMKDWIPGLGARLRGRGGWQYTSPDLSTVQAGPTSISAVAWAPFWNNEHMIAIGNDGHVYADKNLDGITASLVSGGLVPTSQTHPPFWNKNIGPILPRGGLVIMPSYTGYSSGIYKYQYQGLGAYAVAALVGSPPQARIGCSWEEYLLLANGDPTGSAGIYPNRIWVSGVGDPQSWAVGTDFWDSSIPVIIGLVPLRAGILVFGFSGTNIIAGDIPPAGGNWSETEVFGDTGCFDTRCFAKYNEYICFANNNGVYLTDGITLTDLTKISGTKTRWKQLVGPFDFLNGWSAAGGVYRNYYIITVHDQNGVFVTCHVFNIETGTAFELTNIRANMFAHSPLSEGTALITGEERLFMAPKNNLHVEGLHYAWTAPDSMVDGDGANVLPQLETPFYKPGGAGQKVFRSARSTYDVRASAGSTPSLAVDYCTEPDGAYTNAGSLPTTTDEDRQKVDLRVRSRGIGLRYTQAGKSGHTTLSEIELDQNVLEGMR